MLAVPGMLAGCEPDKGPAPPATAGAGVVAAATTATASSPAATDAPAEAPAADAARRKVLTYENVTFSVPETWRISVGDGGACLGDFVPRPGNEARPSLVVSINASAPIDDAMPTSCLGGPAVSVDLVQAGFAPVGERTADFRFWISTCEDGSMEERRAWVLPASRISFVEEYHVDENVQVVSTASVA